MPESPDPLEQIALLTGLVAELPSMTLARWQSLPSLDRGLLAGVIVGRYAREYPVQCLDLMHQLVKILGGPNAQRATPTQHPQP